MGWVIALSFDLVPSTRWRLSIRFSFLVFLLFMMGGAGAYFYVRHTMLRMFDAAHELAIHSVLESINESGESISVNEAEFYEEFAELNLTLGVVAAVVFDHQGKPIVEAGLSHRSPEPVGPPHEIQGEGDHTVVIRRVPIGVNRDGILVVTRRANDIGSSLDSLKKAIGVLLPIILFGAWIVGWVMAGRSLRPVHQAFEYQRGFIADTSHELRTPLSIIRAQAEAQLQGDSSPQQMRSAFEVIARTSAQLSKLVDDLLFLARSDSKKLNPERVEFYFDDLVEETVDSFSVIAASKGSVLTYSAPTESVQFKGDPAQLQRLLGILIDNALVHGEPGEIQISLQVHNGTLCLRVEDNGPGIDPLVLPQVFDRFVRGSTRRTSHNGGLGLGLAIAQSIVDAHDGHITLKRNSRGGTTAEITFQTKVLSGPMG